ncbi:DUF1501 domain-containing protein [Nocardioides sp. Leaf374]|uniref:DUF1501 domain-containing protein n=1 Tax=Nocardioides sp. Leaf374 TaxID=2876560 RepID=UPI001E401F04|nr:DUF1501 domain-containing protein [Nocardioides sp. Leaf374]
MTTAAARTASRTGDPCGCPDYAAATALSRRGFLRGLGLTGAAYAVGSAMVTYGAAPAMAAGVAPAPNGSVLVVLSMRGAADGLSLVVPHGDPAYYAARPRIAVPAAKLLGKDAFFGLHPNLAPLLPMWQSGELAAVHATGMAVVNRSHFAAMELVEDANPGSSVRSGWLNRLLGGLDGDSPLQGVSIGSSSPPASLYGEQPIMSLRNISDAVVAGNDQWDTDQARLRSLSQMWGSSTAPMARGMRSAMAAVADLGPVRAEPENRAAYPDSDLGRALAAVARTIRGDVGVSLVTVDQGEWDMHADLGTLDWGAMKYNANDLATAIAAFFADLGSMRERVTLLTISEFGRRVSENSNYGLDHGWGNVMFLAGAGVKGGRYYGRWPGLENSLDADLTVTTDFRSVLSEVVLSRTDASAAQVFPGFTPEPVGVMVGR